MFSALKKKVTENVSHLMWQHEGRVYLIPKEHRKALFKMLWQADDKADRKILEFNVATLADIMWDSKKNCVIQNPGSKDFHFVSLNRRTSGDQA